MELNGTRPRYPRTFARDRRSVAPLASGRFHRPDQAADERAGRGDDALWISYRLGWPDPLATDAQHGAGDTALGLVCERTESADRAPLRRPDAKDAQSSAAHRPRVAG